MKPIHVPRSDPQPGQPSLQSSTGPSITNNSAPSHSDPLPSEIRTLHTLQNLRVQKAQAELTEAVVRVQIAKEQLEESKHNNLSAQVQVLPHRSLPIKIYNDGLTWIAEYKCPEGEPLVGRGDTPQLALVNFDHQWLGMR